MKIFQKISHLVREEEKISLELHCLGCVHSIFVPVPTGHDFRREAGGPEICVHTLKVQKSRFHVGRKRRNAWLDKKTKRATMFLSLRRRVTPVFFIRSAFLNRGNQKGNPILR